MGQYRQQQPEGRGGQASPETDKLKTPMHSDAEAPNSEAREYRIRATFFYSVKSLIVESGVLGRSVSFSRNGADIEIKLPHEDDPTFPENKFSHAVVEYSKFRVKSPPPLSREREFYTVRAIRVSVRLSGTPEAIDANVYNRADESAAEFIEWLRLQGQTWLGLHGQTPTRISHCVFIDDETGEPPSYSVSVPVAELLNDLNSMDFAGHLIRRFNAALSPESVTTIGQRLAANSQPLLAQQMLADALHFGDRFEPELPRALLFAAIACELRIKTFLLEKAPPEKRDMVSLLFDHPRDFSMQVVGLFDKTMKATVGVSLREQNPQLYKRIDRLFQLRNKIAHKGATADPSAKDCINAAREVFEWLDRTF